MNTTSIKDMHLAEAATGIDVAPWWRQGYLWLIVAGPALVVVAGLVTLVIAVKLSDPLVSENYYREGLDINRTLREAARSAAPAELARNHAATPPRDQPAPTLGK